MNALIAFALRHRVLMLVLFMLTLGGGVMAFLKLNIEAYPDPTPPMVDVITQVPGLSAEEVERYITIPIESQTSALRNLRNVRSISLYGLSDVKLQFTFDFTYEEALQQVLNRLAQLPPLPNGAQPQISPVSPIGEIYRYRLTGPPNYSVMDLKTLQDWVLERRFRAVPGVIDVTGWGGKTKTFELQVDFNRLLSYGLTLPQLLQTVNNSNINVGGNTVDIGRRRRWCAASVSSARSRTSTTRWSPRAVAIRSSCATSPPWWLATSRGSASPARTRTMTSSRASC